MHLDGAMPAAAAAAASEAVRTLNHLTMRAPSADTSGWEDVVDLYAAFGSLHLLAVRKSDTRR